MAGTDFIDFYRSTFMGQRDKVNAEKKAAKAEAKAAQANAEAEKAQDEAKATIDLTEAKEKVNSFLNNLRNAIESAAKEASDRKEATPETPKELEKIEPTTDENTVEYTYKAGDTFGQVIKDLGLETDAGLWGTDGDVAYYTKQLVDQGALDNRGNVPIGTKIKLRRRGAPEIVMTETQALLPDTSSGKPVHEVVYPQQTRTPNGARLV